METWTPPKTIYYRLHRGPRSTCCNGMLHAKREAAAGWFFWNGYGPVPDEVRCWKCRELLKAPAEAVGVS